MYYSEKQGGAQVRAEGFSPARAFSFSEPARRKPVSATLRFLAFFAQMHEKTHCFLSKIKVY